MLLTYIVTFTITYNEATRDVVIVSLKVRNSCCSNNIIINFYIIHNDYYTSDIIKHNRFPACNTGKVRVAWGQGYNSIAHTINGSVHIHCTCRTMHENSPSECRHYEQSQEEKGDNQARK